jgi:hypothetical protein
LNFGVWGYNTMQEVELFKTKGLKYSPDMLILQYDSNDIRNNTRKKELREVITKEYKERGFNVSERRVPIKIQIDVINIYYNELKNKPIQKVWHIVELPLGELHKITSERNITVIFLAFDVKRQIPLLIKICKEYNWYFIDLDDYGLNSIRKEIALHPPEDWHFNKQGHKFTADILFEFLLERKLIPPYLPTQT